MITPARISQALDRILPLVQKPARYTGGEFNTITKPWDDIPYRLVLVFPDIYDLGMSNLGLMILYDIVNRQPDMLAERAYTPWVDMLTAMRQAGLPLYSLESRRPLRAFDVIGFSLPYEQLYTNVLTTLELADIPLRAEDRGNDVPLILACGSFAPRPTRTPRAITPIGPSPAMATPAAMPDAPTPLPEIPTLTPTPSPTSTFTPTPLPGTVLMPGQPARVVAAGGLNVRQRPGIDQLRIGKLAPGALVQVLEGPIKSPPYRWWRVRDKRGLEGWVADSDGQDEWLSPQIGEPRPVNRPVVRGDEVVVTTQKGNVLTVRFEAGLDSVVARRLRAGTRLKVVDGPVDVDGYRWWQVVDQEGRRGWAAEGDQETRWLTPIE